ncbi:hypothetical protein T03_15148 [Trichinella britovi]|uniref:Uncharacterized protein n=1 Tax=Trichinella britovi TaxID=45882 RepID=A0A0V1DAS8_TRIBR|nr:hypothetical protein T03_15148 [Trichinella britovi]
MDLNLKGLKIPAKSHLIEHLMALCNDNTLRMYDAFSCKKPLQIVSLDPSKREIGMSTLNPKYFIGDSAVTFDFGSPLDTKEVEQDGPQY